MATQILVNIGLGNGLLPDSTKPQAITWTNLDLSSAKCCYNRIRAISQKIPQSSMDNISLKIAYLKFHSNL